MMNRRSFALACAFSFLAMGWLLAQEGKPDFSGTWKLNRDRSELRRPTFRAPGGGPGMGGPSGGMGGGDMGGPGGGMGGPGMGSGGGMGGPGMGGPGMPSGGRRGRGGMGGPGQGRGEPEMMGVAEVMEIQQQGSRLIVKEPMRFGTQEQTLEFDYTTDGKENRNTLPGGMMVASRTEWKKNRLVTRSTSKGRMGAMRTTEERSLSEDGMTMTIVSTMRSSFMDARRKLVYDKVGPTSNEQH